MTVLLYSKDGTGQRGAVFRSQLAAGVGFGDTALLLPTGDGAKLPTIPAGYAVALRLGSDADFDEVLVTAKSGDVLTCSAITRESWPLGTALIVSVGALLLNNFVQRPELGTAAAHAAGDFASAAQGAKADTALQALPPVSVIMDDAVAGAGWPIAISRSTGRGILARSDAYTKSFVVGLSQSAVLSGHVCDAATDRLTLTDWTGPAGVANLTPGALYYLQATGGIGTTFSLADQAVAVVGEAVSATTLKLLLKSPTKL